MHLGGCPCRSRKLGMSTSVVIHVDLGSSGCPRRWLSMSISESRDVPVGGYPCRSTKLGSARRRLSMSISEARDVHVSGYPCRLYEAREPRSKSPPRVSSAGGRLERSDRVGRHPQPPRATRVPRSSRVVHADPGHPTIVSPRVTRVAAEGGPSPGRELQTSTRRASRVHPEHPWSARSGASRPLIRARAERTNKHGFSLTRRVAC